jgi:membrane associated rhomboid family serine protease
MRTAASPAVGQARGCVHVAALSPPRMLARRLVAARPRSRSRSRCHASANESSGGGGGGLSDGEIEALLRKYDESSPKPSIPPRSRAQQQPPAAAAAPAPAARPSSSSPARRPPASAAAAAAQPAAGNGTFLLCFLCLAVFLADNVLHLPFARSLYLVHGHGALASPWWTAVTHAFAHANWQHLSANLFPLLIFGKLVEETEGAAGVVLAFCLTAAGAALVSVWLTPGPAVVSVGASGSVFGLFSLAVLTRFSLRDPRKLLEFFILGQFVVAQVLSEARAQAAGGAVLAGGLSVSHVAHLAGALAGVLLVALLRAVPEPPPE